MKKTFLLLIVYFLLSSTPAFAATDYTLLAPIPLDGAASAPSQTTQAKPYIEGIFKLIIGLATGLAVVMIIFGGIKYMSTDAFTGKSDAKDTIRNAIWGLLLIIAAWLILYTINPQLVKFNLEIPIQEIRSAISGGTIPAPSGDCSTCVVVSVPHKEAPIGCAAPGPCTIDEALNTKLAALHALDPLLVTESYPPPSVVPHTDPCHNSGTCVDATISSMTPQNALKFVNDASGMGLNVLVEVTSEAKKSAMIQAGVPSSRVIVTAGNGDHFHIKL
ncbi:MAG: pilin [Patescibacteria group bacterium]